MTETRTGESDGTLAPAGQGWEFAGWGSAERIADLDTSGPASRSGGPAHKLGEWASTAICGNDITSSCLYVSALCALQAGRYAPIALGIVAVVLFLFRKVYAEVGTALPLNGGAYNVLLNTTTKGKASIAACLTLLSYVATAVISAGEAMHYAHNLFHGLPVNPATIALLFLFALLTILGITESAIVALGIFAFHMVTLTVLVVVATTAVLSDPTVFVTNWSTPPERSLGAALLFGFAAAMLGISGFESSANFIEEQEDGVFPKTLRNMWVAVAVFNPLISLLSLGLIMLSDFGSHTNDLLAYMGYVSAGDSFSFLGLTAGEWLRSWVSVDAVLVLSGAVLTSYVGVTGLVRRMSLDRCLPQVLLRENRLRGTNHWIILGFFALCVSILTITKGDVGTLAGVYTLSFLGVMALFAIGNMLLKVERGRLPRAVHASWPGVAIALVAVLVGLVGNVLLDPEYVKVFLIYFGAALTVVGVMFLRIRLLKLGLFVSRAIVERVQRMNRWVRDGVLRRIDAINSLTVVYFTKGDSLAQLNRAALYVLANEQTKRLRVVHAYRSEKEIPVELGEHLRTIDQVYPQLRVDFLAVRGEFGPQLIEGLSRRLGVPKNYMFIGTPSDRFPHGLADLGGVRLIL